MLNYVVDGTIVNWVKSLGFLSSLPCRVGAGFICSCAIALSGCGYRVTLNQQPVYEPKPLFQNFTLADAALSDCVNQTIEDEGVTDAKQLIALHCSYAGIESLEGLARFANLRQVNLSYNEIRDGQPLLKLTKLQRLDLQGNVDLPCDDVKALMRVLPPNSLTPPEHCAKTRQ